MNVSKRCDLYVLHVAIVVGPKQTHSSLVYIEIDWNVENVVFVRHTSSLSLSLSLSPHTQVNDGTTSKFGKHSPIVLTVYRLLQLLMIRYSVAMEVSVPRHYIL